MSAHMTPAQARHETERLLRLHGFADWKVCFGSASAQAGLTIYSSRKIRYSRTLLASRTYEGSLDTVRHEVAHVIAGGAAKHGPRWERAFLALGGSGRVRWESESLVRPEAVFRWAYTCELCGSVLGHSIRRRKFGRYVTRCCSGAVQTRPINRAISPSQRVSVSA